MINTIKCFFKDITERDMDMLFMEEFACSDSFLKIFTDKVGIAKSKVISIHSSKTDIMLGESDMTVIIETGNERIGLLIEDKIDAIAMPRQSERYTLRGQKGVEHGDYNRFFVFIIAPKQYLENNTEAQKYPYQIDYEAILDYYENLNDPRSSFKIQQIRFAIAKQKKGYQVEKDDQVTDFWLKYSEYQKAHYPDLILLYNSEIKGANAGWPRFNTVSDLLYILHKTEQGYADLTFDNCAGKMVKVEQLLSETVPDYLHEGYLIRKTGKSAAIRINTPNLDLHKPFTEQVHEVDISLQAVQKLSDLVKIFDYTKVNNLIEKYI